MKMTIQAFSIKTGLPQTTLRFYESKSLLLPKARGDNGYRYYTEDQVPLARLIASFRQADVPIEDIRLFLQSDSIRKHELLEQWRRDVEEKLKTLQIAKQYLHGVFPEQSSVQLVKWEEQTNIVWFSHMLIQRKHPYKEQIEVDQKKIKEIGLQLFPGAFVRVLSAIGNNIEVKIGYRLQSNSSLQEELEFPAEWNCKIIKYQPTLFITLECRANDPLMCIQYSRMLDKYGFKPIGPRWDWYETGSDETYFVYIPVIRQELQG